MTVTLDLALVGQILAIIVAIGAIYAYLHQRRAFAMAEGKQQEKINALIIKVDGQEKKIADLEGKSHCTDMDMAEIKSDIKYLIGAVNEIKDALGTIAPHTVKL